MNLEQRYLLYDGKDTRELQGTINFSCGNTVKFIQERYRKNEEDGFYVLNKKTRHKTIFVDFRNGQIEHIVEIMFNYFLKLP